MEFREAREDNEVRGMTEGEAIIMKAIWDAGEDIMVTDLIERLREKYHREYARSTVHTFLIVMENKKMVKTYKVGRFTYVHALRTEKEYYIDMANKSTQQWFHGSIAAHISALCSGKRLTKEEIAQIRKIVDELED